MALTSGVIEMDKESDARAAGVRIDELGLCSLAGAEASKPGGSFKEQRSEASILDRSLVDLGSEALELEPSLVSFLFGGGL